MIHEFEVLAVHIKAFYTHLCFSRNKCLEQHC